MNYDSRIERLENDDDSLRPMDITIKTVYAKTEFVEGERRDVIEQIPEDQYEYTDWSPYGHDGSRIRHATPICERSENPDDAKSESD